MSSNARPLMDILSEYVVETPPSLSPNMTSALNSRLAELSNDLASLPVSVDTTALQAQLSALREAVDAHSQQGAPAIDVNSALKKIATEIQELHAHLADVPTDTGDMANLNLTSADSYGAGGNAYMDPFVPGAIGPVYVIPVSTNPPDCVVNPTPSSPIFRDES